MTLPVKLLIVSNLILLIAALKGRTLSLAIGFNWRGKLPRVKLVARKAWAVTFNNDRAAIDEMLTVLNKEYGPAPQTTAVTGLTAGIGLSGGASSIGIPEGYIRAEDGRFALRYEFPAESKRSRRKKT